MPGRRLAAAGPVGRAVIADLRVVLEPGAGRPAAASADPAARRAVGAVMADLRVRAEDTVACVRADLVFGRAVLVASGNDLLLHVHEVVDAAPAAVRPLHAHRAGHHRSTLTVHEQAAVSIQRGHHRKAEAARTGLLEQNKRKNLLERS
ncbi:FCD domain-containing protein [Streptomyces sp. NPDC086519]|uniref:FCD domain-containing protein n=1 Tax=Streptomyces sp. NPDC086519 TaxID=3154863 RepID=UPI0034271068